MGETLDEVEKRAGFFAVGHNTFLAACHLGINPAAAFVVLARGSGRDNITTKWSADAISDRLRVRWTTAKTSIGQLSDAGLVVIERGSTRPSYLLAREGRSIWLPNTVVDGDGARTAPVASLRQTRDRLTLQLFVELYSEQNLREDGGVSREITSMPFKRERVGQWGQWTAWWFFGSNQRIRTASHVVSAHRRQDVTDKDRTAGTNEWSDIFYRFHVLTSLGLLDWVPYLFDGPEGEPIHALNMFSEVGSEAQLYDLSDDAAKAMMSETEIARLRMQTGHLAPVPSHIAEVQLEAIGRLRHRPSTRLTEAWEKESEEAARGHIEQYSHLIEMIRRTKRRSKSAEL